MSHSSPLIATPPPTGRRRGASPVRLYFALSVLIVTAAAGVADRLGHAPVLTGLSAPAARASTGVTNATGTTPAAANNVFGSWDDVLTLKIIPLGALAVGLAAIFGGIRAGSGGLIGGGVIAVLAAILTVALPAIVNEAAGAGFDAVVAAARFPSLLTPLTPVFYMGVRYVRRRW